VLLSRTQTTKVRIHDSAFCVLYSVFCILRNRIMTIFAGENKHFLPKTLVASPKI